MWLFSEVAGDEERSAAAAALDTNGFAVIDHLLGVDALGLRMEALSFFHSHPDAFKQGAVGGGADGDGERYAVKAVRGDAMALVEATDKRLPLLQRLIDEFDTLVQGLARGPGTCESLRVADHRSKPMLAIYPGNGARYMRHIDNPDGNGRILTCLYYLNVGWRAGDGGELRVYRPSAEGGGEVAATIPPLLDRVVVFWSDERVPHEGVFEPDLFLPYPTFAC